MIYPCASVISVFHFRPVDIAEGRWTPLLTDYIYSVLFTDIFIPCLSWMYLFRVAVVSPAFGVDTNQKKKHGYHGLDTDRSFTDLFFDIIWLKILGFGLDFFGFASAKALPSLAKTIQTFLLKSEYPQTAQSPFGG